MRRAWIRWQNSLHKATVEEEGTLVLQDGRRLSQSDVDWQPPPCGTFLALGLNYVDHVSELAFKAPPKEPLVFVKGPAGMVGHRHVSYRPDGVTNMHFEGELVVVIGKPARRVSRRRAMDYVGGYTICNDYAVREYLENYYRPNLRVKSRESLTVLGPWIVDAEHIDHPQDIEIRTYVNGELVQDGNTEDMVFDIPYMIAYLSEFMTLQPGDMLATGTPQGVANVVPGDEITVEVEDVGALTHTIVSESRYFSAGDEAND